MEAKGTRKRWTYAEFARLPTSGSTRYEIIDDELVVTPSPSGRHQQIVTDLVTLLNVFVKSNRLGRVFTGPLDVLFAEGDYFEPDILFVHRDRAHLLGERGVEGPPDLVVEVLSPSTAARDRGVKLDRYRLFGVAEYWVVDPDERTIEVWELAGNAEQPRVVGSGEVLEWKPPPGDAALRIDVGELFEDA
jgi:Uma2 family endonuclease